MSTGKLSSVLMHQYFSIVGLLEHKSNSRAHFGRRSIYGTIIAAKRNITGEHIVRFLSICYTKKRSIKNGENGR